MPSALACGIDEAGRGPIAGPVVAAAVVLDPARPIEGLADSKRLAPARREQLAEAIRARALAWAVAQATVEEIDRLNILQATLLAMRRAAEALDPRPARAWVDGDRSPALPFPATPVVGGDRKLAEVAAASILAKTYRDAQMRLLHERYPEYRFDRHKGYPTAEHLALLARFGPTPAHRRSFAPVRRVLAAGEGAQGRPR
ncbi:MAG: ribonuclease HII [Burkholderiales bacterium]|nr:ribonuclease HII [Burkholderiales bacterium]